MKPYAKEYTLTDSVVQDARDRAKFELFGSAEENMQYARGVMDHVRQLGQEEATDDVGKDNQEGSV
jgi:hypothetical protein